MLNDNREDTTAYVGDGDNFERGTASQVILGTDKFDIWMDTIVPGTDRAS